MSCLPLEFDATSGAEALMSAGVEYTILWISQTNYASLIFKLLRGDIKDLDHQVFVMKGHVGVLAVIWSSHIPLRIVDVS
jgi:hypothetical protein